MELALGLFALGYSGLVLFVLAGSLRRVFPPVRAAWTAFGISAAVHGLTTPLLGGNHMSLALAFWGVPHVLLLPVLLWSARRQETAQ
ncbi:hypothetical protein [Falsiroseomonas sp. CW058]|uniref:hypothetical protein n=1 Tax=Falsiroseomonas sp. CW058 TaxID=3388664 RepID=UPI003D312880